MENYLNDFYHYVATDNEAALKAMDIPHSAIFYCREAIYQKTGIKLSLQETEKYLEEEYGGTVSGLAT